MERLSDSESGNLNAPVILHKLENAMMDMRTGKSPVPDGIPLEFYLAFWPLLGPLLVELILLSIKEDSFSRDINTALISLLLKKGKDLGECASYRLLSLLKADIKIYPKVLAQRLPGHSILTSQEKKTE